MVAGTEATLVNWCCPSCCHAADFGVHDYCSPCSGGKTCFPIDDVAPQVYDPAKDDAKKKTPASSSGSSEKGKFKEKKHGKKTEDRSKELS
ncbi:hypothetical protein B0T10DRAFT_560517 [Thelonectria olida]|uniref:Uncharacterized protein n=1 Tax=Thelonectria olida TaxID=1576542 RepID=A0A9P9AN39_9HYPO|nr:hypothetical protein B0T10DRAFT_560517 [Thelonectria olida]